MLSSEGAAKRHPGTTRSGFPVVISRLVFPVSVPATLHYNGMILVAKSSN